MFWQGENGEMIEVADRVNANAELSTDIIYTLHVKQSAKYDQCSSQKFVEILQFKIFKNFVL